MVPGGPIVMDFSCMGNNLSVVIPEIGNLAALIVATAGIHMCQYAVPQECADYGKSELMLLLGINTFVAKEKLEKCVEQEGFGYTQSLDTYYKRFNYMMFQSNESSNQHFNSIIAAITNPVDPRLLTKRIIGVGSVIDPHTVAKACYILNQKGVTHVNHGFFVRGLVSDNDNQQSIDAFSICEGGTQLVQLRLGVLGEVRIYAREFGLKPVSLSSVAAPHGMSRGQFSLAILKGEIVGPPLQMVLANAAALFYLAARSQDLKVCYSMTEAIFRTGKVYQKALAIRDFLSK